MMILILSLFTVFTINEPAWANEGKGTHLTVKMDNYSQSINDARVIINGKEYFALRDITVFSGANIAWTSNEAEKKAIISVGSSKYQLVQDSKNMLMETEKASFSYVVVDGSIYLPLEFFEHIINYNIAYENGVMVIDKNLPPNNVAKENWKSYKVIVNLPKYVKTTKAVEEKVKYSYYQTGLASWYGGAFEGRRTANGEKFSANNLTAAHRYLPFGTVVRVTNLSNNKSVEVVINDRGPYCGSRIIDLSQNAARQIGLESKGVGSVRLDIVEKK